MQNQTQRMLQDIETEVRYTRTMIRRDALSPEIMAAMEKVPRHLFVEEQIRESLSRAPEEKLGNKQYWESILLQGADVFKDEVFLFDLERGPVGPAAVHPLAEGRGRRVLSPGHRGRQAVTGSERQTGGHPLEMVQVERRPLEVYERVLS